MFSVLFEVNPHEPQWNAYLDLAKALRPDLEEIDGFVDNIRYRSLTRPGWILSLSGWRDEKSLVRWRTRARHHDAQVAGRERILADYHLRVGQITADTHVPEGQQILEQRLDETHVGAATTVVLLDAQRPGATEEPPQAIAAAFGLRPGLLGLVEHDVYEAVLTPGDVLLMTAWAGAADAEDFASPTALPAQTRRRQIRVVRDYGMYDRRENPQYYPERLPSSVTV
ncbi:MAG TPA: antibiotic biosynthesis monooxygenase [Sporichthyaceae bacterium]|jgi:heme-degrading monooxygenase HmoA|nr:antibiotic biosynthesis monooxygenase [Sporichthyaceae bacterium]